MSKTEVIVIAGIIISLIFLLGGILKDKKYYVYLACSVVVTFMSATVPSLIDVWYAEKEEKVQNDK